MLDKKLELMRKMNISESLYDKCYVSPKGVLYTPYDGKTGEEIYNEQQESKDNIVNEYNNKTDEGEELKSEIQLLKKDNSIMMFALIEGGLL